MKKEYSSDIAFTPMVKAIQSRNGSRGHYSRQEAAGSWQTEITAELEAFIAAQSSCFFATSNAMGQPYIQHRGGPPGFLRVLDAKSLAFIDFTGNRQFITQGNLAENPKAHLFLIDYTRCRRIKLWGKAQVVEGDADLSAALMPESSSARAGKIIRFILSAWDENCLQHIPQRFDAMDVAAAIASRDARIAALEAELASLGQDPSNPEQA